MRKSEGVGNGAEKGAEKKQQTSCVELGVTNNLPTGMTLQVRKTIGKSCSFFLGCADRDEQSWAACMTIFSILNDEQRVATRWGWFAPTRFCLIEMVAQQAPGQNKNDKKWWLLKSLRTTENECGIMKPEDGPKRIWYFMKSDVLLLMEEIANNHLGCIKPCKSWDKLHINWCRISSINSRYRSYRYLYKNSFFHPAKCFRANVSTPDSKVILRYKRAVGLEVFAEKRYIVIRFILTLPIPNIKGRLSKAQMGSNGI